jgi:FixJ family two-component response regulator
MLSMTSARVCRRVAVVDDDESICEALSSLLRSAGYQCSMFTSAETFLASGGLSGADCLVLDVQMKGMSGLDLQAKVRESNMKIPIIYLTANCNEHVRNHAFRHGAIAVLGKPVTYELLLRAIGDATSGSHHNPS